MCPLLGVWGCGGGDWGGAIRSPIKFTNTFSSAPTQCFSAERNECLCLCLHSSLWKAWWFGGWRVSQQCIAPFHPGAVQSSCPIKQAASPGPLPQASSQRLFLHHLFSVTHLQLNCGGCCIPPITTSYTSP